MQKLNIHKCRRFDPVSDREGAGCGGQRPGSLFLFDRSPPGNSLNVRKALKLSNFPDLQTRDYQL